MEPGCVKYFGGPNSSTLAGGGGGAMCLILKNFRLLHMDRNFGKAYIGPGCSAFTFGVLMGKLGRASHFESPTQVV